jgi:hypothetical protein
MQSYTDLMPWGHQRSRLGGLLQRREAAATSLRRTTERQYSPGICRSGWTPVCGQ